jgi:DNA-binding PadR family transcriptional regulator
MSSANSTTHVILGMLGWRPMSGYEIKSIVDKSTRMFWAASYGQIYPELRRLEAAGLVEGQADPTGGRRRIVYRLTAAGREELRRWLAEEPEVYEVRDEGVLKLFFAAAHGESAPATLRAMHRRHLEKLGQLQAIEAREGPEGYAGLVLRYGIEMTAWQADWCERAAARLEAEQKKAA